MTSPSAATRSALVEALQVGLVGPSLPEGSPGADSQDQRADSVSDPPAG